MLWCFGMFRDYTKCFLFLLIFTINYYKPQDRSYPNLPNNKILQKFIDRTRIFVYLRRFFLKLFPISASQIFVQVQVLAFKILFSIVVVEPACGRKARRVCRVCGRGARAASGSTSHNVDAALLTLALRNCLSLRNITRPQAPDTASTADHLASLYLTALSDSSICEKLSLQVSSDPGGTTFYCHFNGSRISQKFLTGTGI